MHSRKGGRGVEGVKRKYEKLLGAEESFAKSSVWFLESSRQRKE